MPILSDERQQQIREHEAEWQRRNAPVQTDNWYKGDKPTSSEFLAYADKVSKISREAGDQLYANYAVAVNDPKSFYYNPYSSPTNKVVFAELAKLGIDTSRVDDDWFKTNESLLEGVALGIDGTPIKGKTKESKAAYYYYKASLDENTTKAVEGEWETAKQEINYWANRTDLNLSDEEILKKLDFPNKYKGLSAIDESRKTGSIYELNRPVEYSQDGLLGAVWAARNQTTGSSMSDAVQYRLGRGNSYKPDPVIRERLSPTSPKFNPYLVGSTMDDVTAFFGVQSINREWLEQNTGAIRESGDERANAYLDKAWEANDFTEAVERESSLLVENENKIKKSTGTPYHTTARAVSELVYKGATIDEALEQYLNDNNYKSLGKIAASLRYKSPEDTTRAIGFDYYGLKDYVAGKVPLYNLTRRLRDKDFKFEISAEPNNPGIKLVDKISEMIKADVVATNGDAVEGNVPETKVDSGLTWYGQLFKNFSTFLMGGQGNSGSGGLPDATDYRLYNAKFINYKATDFSNRPIVTVTKDNIETVKGWELEANIGDKMTVASQSFDNGKGEYVVVTPILPDGTLLSQEKLKKLVWDYFDGIALPKEFESVVLAVFDGENALNDSNGFAESLHQNHEKQLTSDGSGGGGNAPDAGGGRPSFEQAEDATEIYSATEGQGGKFGTSFEEIEDNTETYGNHGQGGKFEEKAVTPTDSSNPGDWAMSTTQDAEFNAREDAKDAEERAAVDAEKARLAALIVPFDFSAMKDNSELGRARAFIKEHKIESLDKYEQVADSLGINIREVGINTIRQALAMTDDEYNRYTLIKDEQGKEKADLYFEYLRESRLNDALRAEDETQAIKGAKEHPFFTAVGSVAINAYVKPLESFIVFAEKLISGKDIEKSDTRNGMGNISNVGRATIFENATAVGKFFGEGFLSIADNLAGRGAFGSKTLYTMGLSAAGDTVQNAMDRGATSDQAITLGIVAGLAETLTEKLDFNRFTKALKSFNGAGFKTILGNMIKGGLRSAFPEALEEGVTGIANLVADVSVMGDKSETMIQHNAIMDAYLQKGYSRAEASDAAWNDVAKSTGSDLLLQSAQGGLSGLVLGEFGEIGSTFNSNANTKAAAETSKNLGNQEDAIVLVSQAMNSNADTKTLKVYEAQALDTLGIDSSIVDTIKQPLGLKKSQGLFDILRKLTDPKAKTDRIFGDLIKKGADPVSLAKMNLLTNALGAENATTDNLVNQNLLTATNRLANAKNAELQTELDKMPAPAEGAQSDAEPTVDFTHTLQRWGAKGLIYVNNLIQNGQKEIAVKLQSLPSFSKAVILAEAQMENLSVDKEAVKAQVTDTPDVIQNGEIRAEEQAVEVQVNEAMSTQDFTAQDTAIADAQERLAQVQQEREVAEQAEADAVVQTEKLVEQANQNPSDEQAIALAVSALDDLEKLRKDAIKARKAEETAKHEANKAKMARFEAEDKIRSEAEIQVRGELLKAKQAIAERQAKVQEQKQAEAEKQQPETPEAIADAIIQEQFPDATPEDRQKIIDRLKGVTELKAPVFESKDFVKKAEAKFGVKIVADENVKGAEEGYYDPSDNSIHLNPNATQGDALVGVAMHELTHSAQTSGWYKGLSDTVLNILYGNDEAQQERDIQAKIDRYARDGKTLSPEQALEEIVAQGIRNKVFTDADSINRLLDTDVSLAQKILETLNRIIASIKDTFAGTNTADLLKARDLLEKALTDRGEGGGKQFSLSEPMESAGSLVAVHNVNERAMKAFITNEGAPMISIAITKAEMGYSEFGEYSLVFGKETVDPQADNRNKVYSSDAWTPTYPREQTTEMSLDAIVELMNKEQLQNAVPDITWAVKQYNSLDQIRDDSSRLGMVEDYYGLKADLLKKFEGIVANFDKSNNPFGKKNRRFVIAETLRGLVQTGETSVDAIQKGMEFRSDYMKLNAIPENSQKFADLLNEIYELPTGYFEAKPRRVIGMNEVKAAIVPDIAEADVINSLETRGVQVYQYKAGDNSDRLTKLNALESVMFSLSDETDSNNTPLTVEQAEYFKDSKVRDENGNLLRVYHGTDAKFTQFNTKSMPQFFTASQEYAGSYGKNVMSVHLNITAPFDTRNPDALAIFNSGFRQYAKTRFGKDIQAYETGDMISFVDADLLYPFLHKMQREGKLNYDGIVISEGLSPDGYGVSYVPLNENQAKDIANQSPTTNPDIRYSLSDDQIDAAIARYGAMKRGETPANERQIPKQTDNNSKVRGFVKNVSESDTFNAEQHKEYEQKIANGEFNYEPISDEKAMYGAEKVLKKSGVRGLQKAWDSASNNPGKLDIAIGERLLRAYAEKGDTDNAMVMVSELAETLTRAGQTVQAARLLKRMTNSGVLYYLKKSLDRVNDEFDTDIQLDPALVGELLNAKTEEDRTAAVEKLSKNAGQQIPPNWKTRLNAWRYFAMLGNPRTHIRNFIGNAAFVPAVRIKSKLGALMEGIANTKERTKVVITDRTLYNQALTEADEIENALKAGGKYNPTDSIEQYRKSFGDSVVGKALEAVTQANLKALEWEDWKFLRRHYAYSLAGYLQANKVDLDSASPELLVKARAYALSEAQKATYRDASALATALNKISKRGGIVGAVVEGILPFKKTPVNILKRGVEYSPIGLMDTLTRGIKQVSDYKNTDGKKGISPVQFIDKLSAGMTGTAIAVLGAFLAGKGLIKLGFKDDKEDEFDRLTGKQEYALEVFGQSITLDWLVPGAMPMFVGASIYEMAKKGFPGMDLGEIAGQVGTALTTIAEPIFNLSMLQGVSNAIESAAWSQESPITAIGINSIMNLGSQMVPTLLGQIARTSDPVRRTVYADKNSLLGNQLGRVAGAIQNKIPGAISNSQPYLDVWGREDIQNNPIMRAFENFISPAYIDALTPDAVEDMLREIHKLTGDNDVLPGTAAKKFTVDKVEINLTGEQYTLFNKTRGATMYSVFGTLLKDKTFQSLSVELKAKALAEVIDYSTQVGKEILNVGFKMDSTKKPFNKNPAKGIVEYVIDGEKTAKQKGYRQTALDSIIHGDPDSLEATYGALYEWYENEYPDDSQKQLTSKVRTYLNDKTKEAYLTAYADGDDDTMELIEDTLSWVDIEYDYDDWKDKAD